MNKKGPEVTPEALCCEKQGHDTSVPPKINPDSKRGRVLRHLADGYSLNRFEAEKNLHDHCLNSTVSELERFGVMIRRKWETVRGYQGHPTRVMRYWLDPEEQQRAQSLLTV